MKEIYQLSGTFSVFGENILTHIPKGVTSYEVDTIEEGWQHGTYHMNLELSNDEPLFKQVQVFISENDLEPYFTLFAQGEEILTEDGYSKHFGE